MTKINSFSLKAIFIISGKPLFACLDANCKFVMSVVKNFLQPYFSIVLVAVHFSFIKQ